MDEELPRELEDVPEGHRERARELQMRIFVLEARLSDANFEDKEAYRRKINELQGELDLLRDD